MKIHYTGQQGAGWGWGEFGTNMVREFIRAGIYTDDPAAADCILHPLADHDLNAVTEHRAPVNFAVCFFEFALGPRAVENAAKYDVIFAGSTWCIERLAERGIRNTALLIQGVDATVFSPQPRRGPDGQFRIFSGGKFEFRKGQDLVIAAFREFAKSHHEAHLVAAWHNPWPSLFASMANSPHINPAAFGNTQPDFFAALLELNGIPRDRFTALPQLSHTVLSLAMESTAVGLFPNRCEGGTNLVLMEYAALGRPVIANVQTGHADVAHAVRHIIPATADPDTGWAVQEVADIVAQMEVALVSRHFLQPPAPRWPWSAAAEIVAQRYFTCVK